MYDIEVVWRSFHMDKQRQDDQLEPNNSSFVLIQDVALKTYRER